MVQEAVVEQEPLAQMEPGLLAVMAVLERHRQSLAYL
jgi:hypothetical protein